MDTGKEAAEMTDWAVKRSHMLLEYAGSRYPRGECPAIYAQTDEWIQTSPLRGCRVLDATPVFFNTLMKHAALLAGGASLTVEYGGMPFDPEAVSVLRDAGVRTVSPKEAADMDFDAVLDCGGINASVRSRYGYAELTRSGVYKYAGHRCPVILVDSGVIKTIETGLGTGDGFVRALREIGLGDLSGRNIVVFGCGKVGRGVAVRCIMENAGHVTVVDDMRSIKPPAGAHLIDMRDAEGISNALRGAWCAVAATGIRCALERNVNIRELADSGILVANMGVEDEFGPDMPAERVLNGKSPLNFILREPTRMRYIDPTMALDNFAAVKLCSGGCVEGVSLPDPDLEQRILENIRSGAVGPELERFGRALGFAEQASLSDAVAFSDL